MFGHVIRLVIQKLILVREVTSNAHFKFDDGVFELLLVYVTIAPLDSRSINFMLNKTIQVFPEA